VAAAETKPLDEALVAAPWPPLPQRPAPSWTAAYDLALSQGLSEDEAMWYAEQACCT
jgi:hypothetical protein